MANLLLKITIAIAAIILTVLFGKATWKVICKIIRITIDAIIWIICTIIKILVMLTKAAIVAITWLIVIIIPFAIAIVIKSLIS